VTQPKIIGSDGPLGARACSPEGRQLRCRGGSNEQCSVRNPWVEPVADIDALRAVTDDPLLLWAAQGMRAGVRAWASGEAVVVAVENVAGRDWVAVCGPVEDVAPMVAAILAEDGPRYRPLGDEELLTALCEAVPGLTVRPPFGWMLRDGPTVRSCAADAWSTPGVGLLAGVAASPHARGQGLGRARRGQRRAERTRRRLRQRSTHGRSRQSTGTPPVRIVRHVLPPATGRRPQLTRAGQPVLSIADRNGIPVCHRFDWPKFKKRRQVANRSAMSRAPMTTIAAPENRLTARAAVGRACRMARANRPRQA